MEQANPCGDFDGRLALTGIKGGDSSVALRTRCARRLHLRETDKVRDKRRGTNGYPLRALVHKAGSLNDLIDIAMGVQITYSIMKIAPCFKSRLQETGPWIRGSPFKELQDPNTKVFLRNVFSIRIYVKWFGLAARLSIEVKKKKKKRRVGYISSDYLHSIILLAFITGNLF